MSDSDDAGNRQMPLGFDDTGAPRRLPKSDTAFRTISEVATDLGVPQHVLRFWESKFSQVRPLKRGGGRRYYRPEDVTVLRRIKALLYDDGMTIRGVQKILREPASKTEGADAPSGPPPAQSELRQILAELTALRDDLRDALRDA